MLTNWKAGLILPVAVICLSVVLFETTNAQCIDDPGKKTALKFSNESRFELRFFVDEDEVGVVVPPKTVSREIVVEPGEHMLRARAIVRGESFWVWTVNEVPQGQICTWTVEDPPRTSVAVDNRFRTTINIDAKTRDPKARRRQRANSKFSEQNKGE